MNREEFKKYIKSIGFEYDNITGFYDYKEFRIYLWYGNYNFWNGSEWKFAIPYNDLTKLFRGIKLKKILE